MSEFVRSIAIRGNADRALVEEVGTWIDQIGDSEILITLTVLREQPVQMPSREHNLSNGQEVSSLAIGAASAN